MESSAGMWPAPARMQAAVLRSVQRPVKQMQWTSRRSARPARGEWRRQQNGHVEAALTAGQHGTANLDAAASALGWRCCHTCPAIAAAGAARCCRCRLTPPHPCLPACPAAAIARRVYIAQGMGVGAMRRAFGGRSNAKGRVTPEHHAKAAGGVIRHALQQLEAMGLVEKNPAAQGGRRITPEGQRQVRGRAGGRAGRVCRWRWPAVNCCGRPAAAGSQAAARRALQTAMEKRSAAGSAAGGRSGCSKRAARGGAGIRAFGTASSRPAASGSGRAQAAQRPSLVLEHAVLRPSSCCAVVDVVDAAVCRPPDPAPPLLCALPRRWTWWPAAWRSSASTTWFEAPEPPS